MKNIQFYDTASKTKPDNHEWRAEAEARVQNGVQEQVVGLNAEEANFVEVQSRWMLRGHKRENERKRRQGIPPPPTPGKISYAVYM